MIRIIALTEAGKRLAETLQQGFPDSEIWYKPKPFRELVQQAFCDSDRLIFICATGIVVRTLAPVLNNKYEDPAVLVLDEQGKFVIPLLSGHEGGANDWAQQVADNIQSQLVVTTANPYLKPVYTVGMGCERNCPEEYLMTLLLQSLEQAGLTIDDVQSIHSIDIKADEVGLIELAKQLNKPFFTWNKQQLGRVESLLSAKSEYVYSVVGVYGVSESAALYSAQNITGQISELVLTKQKNAKATCAIARSFPQS